MFNNNNNHSNTLLIAIKNRKYPWNKCKDNFKKKI